jgi:hypothetical protein
MWRNAPAGSANHHLMLHPMLPFSATPLLGNAIDKNRRIEIDLPVVTITSACPAAWCASHGTAR